MDWKKVEIDKLATFREIDERKVFDISDVEIFSTGKWNGDNYTKDDLDDLVKSFNEIGKDIKPYMKLGHDDGQKLLQQDGYPSAGWVTGLKRVGEKLLASFSSVPEKIYNLIKSKAYGRFSSEIFWGLKLGDKKFNRVLKAVALLGGDTPAVSNLDDFINLYENNYDYDNLKLCNNRGDNMDEIKKYELEIIQLKDDVKLYELENNKLKSEVTKLTNYISTQEQAQKEKDVKAYIDDRVKEGKVVPAQVDQLVKLGLADFDSVKAIVDNAPKYVEFKESSEKGKDKEKKYSEMNEEEKDDYLNTKALKYARENKVSYGDAYDVISDELDEEVN